MTPDLHELANTPGAGKAAKALREAGLWQERTADDLPVWQVEVDVTISGQVYVNVAAKDKEEARAAAERWCKDNPDRASELDGYDSTEYEARNVKPTHESPDE